jgi:hypothetical protein
MEQKLTCFCTEKVRDNKGIILGYRLRDIISGQQDFLTSEQLKNAIRSNQLNVVNLTLTTDNRIVDASQNKIDSFTKKLQGKNENIQDDLAALTRGFDNEADKLIDYSIQTQLVTAENKKLVKYLGIAPESTSNTVVLKFTKGKDVYVMLKYAVNITDYTADSYKVTNSKGDIAVTILGIKIGKEYTAIDPEKLLKLSDITGRQVEIDCYCNIEITENEKVVFGAAIFTYIADELQKTLNRYKSNTEINNVNSVEYEVSKEIQDAKQNKNYKAGVYSKAGIGLTIFALSTVVFISGWILNLYWTLISNH